MRLEFGLQPPAGATVAWGARAIFHPDRDEPIDMLMNRQDAFGSEDGKRELFKWLDESGMPALREALAEQGLRRDSKETITIKDGKFTLKASPRASYGYLYIGAWFKGPPTARTWRPSKSRKKKSR